MSDSPHPHVPPELEAEHAAAAEALGKIQAIRIHLHAMAFTLKHDRTAELQQFAALARTAAERFAKADIAYWTCNATASADLLRHYREELKTATDATDIARLKAGEARCIEWGDLIADTLMKFYSIGPTVPVGRWPAYAAVYVWAAEASCLVGLQADLRSAICGNLNVSVAFTADRQEFTTELLAPLGAVHN